MIKTVWKLNEPVEMKNAAFLIFACDRYELLFKGFDHFFTKNWANPLGIERYFATEEKDLKLKNYTQLKSGKGEWTNRLKIILDQINADYIIFIQEDMWFSKTVPEQSFHKILSHTISNNIKLVKLHSSEVYLTEKSEHNFDGLSLCEVNKKESRFLMSHQVSIWEKKFLYAQLKDNENPWRNERRGTKRLKKSKEKIFQIDLLSENGKEPINQNSSSFSYGEYFTISENACLSKSIKNFLPTLQHALPEYEKQLSKNFETQTTHDGKEMPRKNDFFKKMKDKLFPKK